MKQKILILVSLLVVLVGCSLTGSTTSPKRAVEDLFGKYQALDEEVLTQLDDVIAGETLTTDQKIDYEELMRKQYQNLTYTIKDEVIDGNTAVVTVEIEVYDFAKTNKETETYVAAHESEFLGDDNLTSDVLYQEYKIGKLKSVTDRIKYTLDLELTKTDDEWKMEELSDTERQKIHGLYTV